MVDDPEEHQIHGHGGPGVVVLIGLHRGLVEKLLLQGRQLVDIVARKNRVAAPGAGVEVLVVEVKRGSVAFTLPLAATPEGEDLGDGLIDLFTGQNRAAFAGAGQNVENIPRALLFDDEQFLDAIDEMVGTTQVRFVRLMERRGFEFGGWNLAVDQIEGGKVVGDLSPRQPLEKEDFVDAGHRCEAAGGVAVHGAIADCGFAAVASREEEEVFRVGDGPDRRIANACLDVLAGDVVALPVERTSQKRAQELLTLFDQGRDVEVHEPRTDLVCNRLRRIECRFAAVGRSLVGAREETSGDFTFVRTLRQPGKRFEGSACFTCGEAHHEVDENGAHRRVGSTRKRQGIAAAARFFEIVEEAQCDRFRKLLFLALHGARNHWRRDGAGLVRMPREGMGDDSCLIEVRTVAGQAGPSDAVAFDVHNGIGQRPVCKTKPGRKRTDTAGARDEAITVVDGPTCFVADQVGIDVGAIESPRPIENETFPRHGFAEGEMTGRGIEYDIDPMPRVADAGSAGHPSIFADFQGEADSADLIDHITQRNRVALRGGELGDGIDGPLFEEAGFVVNTITREVLFPGEAQQHPVHDHSDHVVGAAGEAQWQADGGAKAFYRRHDLLLQNLQGSLRHIGRMKFVFAAVAGDAQLRKADEVDLAFGSLSQHGQDFFGITDPVLGRGVDRGCGEMEGFHDFRSWRGRRRVAWSLRG